MFSWTGFQFLIKPRTNFWKCHIVFGAWYQLINWLSGFSCYNLQLHHLCNNYLLPSRPLLTLHPLFSLYTFGSPVTLKSNNSWILNKHNKQCKNQTKVVNIFGPSKRSLTVSPLLPFSPGGPPTSTVSPCEWQCSCKHLALPQGQTISTQCFIQLAFLKLHHSIVSQLINIVCIHIFLLLSTVSSTANIVKEPFQSSSFSVSVSLSLTNPNKYTSKTKREWAVEPIRC